MQTATQRKHLPLTDEDAGFVLGAIERLLMASDLGGDLEARLGVAEAQMKPEAMEYVGRRLVRCATLVREVRAHQLPLDDDSLRLLAELSEEAEAHWKDEAGSDPEAHPDDLVLARARTVKLNVLYSVAERIAGEGDA